MAVLSFPCPLNSYRTSIQAELFCYLRRGRSQSLMFIFRKNLTDYLEFLDEALISLIRNSSLGVELYSDIKGV